MLKRTPLRRKSKSDTALIKDEIQRVLREIVMLRDGGCVFRHYENEITPQYRHCGGYRKDGELILQAEHLHTRSNMASFADSRLVVCICKLHHIFYKPQHGDEYYRIVKKHIGGERAKLLQAVQDDWKPHKVDLKMELIALNQELKKLQNASLS